MKLILLFLTLPMFAFAAPRVSFTYAGIFDSACSRQTHYKIESKWVEELRRRLPEFRGNWGQMGVQLLDTAQAIVGKPFRQGEFEVSLSLCSFPSMSDPLMVNMRYSLASFIQAPLPPEVTVSIFFHEILHKYLRGKIRGDSALLHKYQNEDKSVLSHLHLFALQKAVYLKLDQISTLDAVIKKDISLTNPVYKRAWEIVNELEGFEAFVNELKN